MKIAKSIAKAYYRALGYYPGNISGFNFKLDPYHIAFWRSAANGRWEPRTYKILSEFLNAGSVYCDIGAWIGPTAIYAAKKCKEVFAFEPDPVAYRYLRWNIELNQLDNVRSFNFAISNRLSLQKMSSFGGSLGDSMSSLLPNEDQAGEVSEVLTMTWENIIDISKIDKIDFIKIDIEGGEFEVLPAMKDYIISKKPIVYLSAHCPFVPINQRVGKIKNIIEVLSSYNNCLNDNLESINIDTMLSECKKGVFSSYLFVD
jgi:FkbM family methyltransferase